MKKLLIICGCLAVMACGGCTSTIRMLTSEAVSLDYVGKVRIGTPLTQGRVTSIPVEFEGGKWGMNSVIVFKGIRARQHNHEIGFTVLTCVTDGKTKGAPAEIKLKDLVSGQYPVFYLNPDGSKERVGVVSIIGK